MLILCLILVWIVGCLESQESRCRRWNKRGDAFFAEKNYEAAIREWERVLSVKPNAVEILSKIGKTHLRLAEYSKADEAFIKVIQLKSDAWDVWLEMGKLRLLRGDLGAAEEIWAKLSKSGEKNPLHHVFRGDILVLRNQVSKAIPAYRLALSIDPHCQVALIKLASCQLAQKEFESADQTYQLAASLDSASPEILYQMSHFWKLKGNFERAEEFLKRAVRLEPNDLSLKKLLADFYFDLHQFEKARQTLTKILEQDRMNRSVRKVLIEVLLAQNKISEAQTLLDDLSKGNENDIELELLKGKYRLLIFEPVLAVNHFISVLEKEPKLALAHYLLGLAYLASGQRYLARQSVIQALTLNPFFSEAELTLADIYYKQGDLDTALEHARRVGNREPENFRAHLVMGNCFLAQRRYEEAGVQFRIGQGLRPEMPFPLYQMALSAELSNQPEKAMVLYRTLLNLQPNLADATLRYTRIMTQLGKMEAAVQFLQEGINGKEGREGKGYLQYILGELYLSADNLEKAKTWFERSILLDSRLGSAYMRLSQIAERNGNREEQIQILEDCAERIPEMSEARLELARLYFQKGLWEKSVSILEGLLARYPESPIAANNLAWLYLEKDVNLEKALTLAQAAYERFPQDPAIADTLGWIYYKIKVFSKAAQIISDALSHDPGNPIISFHLGMVAYAQGNAAEASRNLNSALAQGLGDPYRKEAETIIQGIR